MKNLLLYAVHLVLCCVVCILPTADAEGFSTTTVLSEWRIEDAVGSVSHNEWVSLRNTYSHKKIAYGEREYGINLVWSTTAANNIRFRRQNGAAGPVQIGEHVALYVLPGGYLSYAERPYGINLKWSSAPVYEWEIRGGGSVGDPVNASVAHGLFNTTRNDYVVYCERTYGINLRWNSDCDCRTVGGCSGGGSQTQHICGLGGCRSGWHEISFQHGSACVGAGKNQTTCAIDDQDFWQCGIGGCPVGCHITDYSSVWACDPDTIPSSGTNQTHCVQDAAPGFWQCGSGCPSGYTQTQQQSSLSCSPSGGTGAVRVYCDAD